VEIDRLFAAVRPEAERRGSSSVAFLAKNARGIGRGFSFRRAESGEWRPPSGPAGANVASAMQGGAALTLQEVDQVREAVASIPDNNLFGTAQLLGTCVLSKHGITPTIVTADYVDDAVDADRGQRFETIAEVMRREATEAACREVVITVRSQGHSEAYKIVRASNGVWSPPIPLSE
jgi:hypothetical protein